MKDEELKQKYMQYRYMQQQSEELQKHIAHVQEQEAQFVATVQAIEELKDAKPGSEIYVPVANGIFVRGTIYETNEFLVNVGAGVVCSKAKDETAELHGRQQDSMKEVEEHLMKQYAYIAKKMEELEAELSVAVE